MLINESLECDECGRNDVVGSIGANHHYCSRHEEKVAAIYAKDKTEEQSEGVL